MSHKPTISLVGLGGMEGNVTGSSNVVRTEFHHKVNYVLVDCGQFQGKQEIQNMYYPVKGEFLNAVIVTHSHMDHIGLLPQLVKEYDGKIYGTKETEIQMMDLLYDAVKKNERDAAMQLGIAPESFSQMKSIVYYAINDGVMNQEIAEYKAILEEINSYTLFGTEDVEKVRKQYVAVEPYTDFRIDDGVYARLIPMTSHQNGACYVELYVGDYGADSVNMVFSGDIGPEDSLLYKTVSKQKNELINYLMLEGTHGTEERQQSVAEAVSQVEKLVFETIRKNRTLVIAGFALDRLAQILYVINLMIDKYGIEVPVYFDSPLATKELKHYQDSYRNANGKSHWFKELANEPFDTNEVIVTTKYRDHEAIFRQEGAKVILTSSAFGEGGRVIDFFDKCIQDKNTTFVFAGWLSPDCESKKLMDAEEGTIVEMKKRNYVKHCKTVQLQGFTSHGYYPEMKSFINKFPNLLGLCVNHGDVEAKDAIIAKLKEQGYTFSMITPDMYNNSESEKAVVQLTATGMKTLTMAEGVELFKKIINY